MPYVVFFEEIQIKSAFHADYYIAEYTGCQTLKIRKKSDYYKNERKN